MARRLGQMVVALVVVVAAAQFVRPAATSAPIDARQTIAAGLDASSELSGVLTRSCGDCHSNAAAPAMPWYAKVAPVSWVIARGVSEGRQVLNFSEWGTYTPQQQHDLLEASCAAASNGRMPGGAYTWVRPDVRLSQREVRLICAAVPEAGTHAANQK